jgi:hypothetical protein
MTVHLTKKSKVTFNNKLVTLPFTQNGIIIRQASTLFIEGMWNVDTYTNFINNVMFLNFSYLVQLPNGISVLWECASRLYIVVPARFYGKTQVNFIQ